MYLTEGVPPHRSNHTKWLKLVVFELKWIFNVEIIARTDIRRPNVPLYTELRRPYSVFYTELHSHLCFLGAQLQILAVLIENRVMPKFDRTNDATDFDQYESVAAHFYSMTNSHDNPRFAFESCWFGIEQGWSPLTSTIQSTMPPSLILSRWLHPFVAVAVCNKISRESLEVSSCRITNETKKERWRKTEWKIKKMTFSADKLAWRKRDTAHTHARTLASEYKTDENSR